MMRDISPKLYDVNYRRKVYPPVVLLIGSNPKRLQHLCQRLERQGYDVESHLNIHLDEVASVYQKHFDLVILDVEVDDLDGAKNNELRQSLLLLNTPIVIISPNGVAEQVTQGLPFPVYHISKDDSMSSMSPIIEQVHYISYRYM